MKKLMLMLLAFGLLATPMTAQSTVNPDKGPGSMDVVTGGGVAMPDDAYDGTQATMACFTVTGPELVVEDVTLDLAINHTWAGDLVAKVWSPSGTVVTLFSRPDFAEPADDGTGCCGADADLTSAAPISFNDANVNDAETMGAALGGADFICQTDGVCDFFPNPDSGPGTSLADFNGEEATGDWTICVGDSAAGDTGDVIPGASALSISGAPLATLVDVPTMGTYGMTALLIALMFAGLFFIRRK